MRRDALSRLRTVIRKLGGATRAVEQVAHDLRHAKAVPGLKGQVSEVADALRGIASDLDALAMPSPRRRDHATH